MTSMQQAVYRAFFIERLKQHEVADLLKMKRPAVAMRLLRIRQRYLAAGLTPPANPGSGLRTVTPGELFPDN